MLADGREIAAGAVILTTGTFLSGLIHMGEETIPAGRVGEAPALGLSQTLARFGFALGRLKTGTPPRLDGRTIDWAGLDVQPGDDPPEPFSYLTDGDHHAPGAVPYHRDHPGEPCADPRQSAPGADVFRPDQEHGPRYCPSIEDKVVRFAARERHQIFLEPEGLDDPTVYPNGISTSLPREVQDGAAQDHSGPGTGRHAAAGLRHRIRLRRSPGARP